MESHLRYQPHAGEWLNGRLSRLILQGRGSSLSRKCGDSERGAARTDHYCDGMLRPGDVVAVDALTYPGFKAWPNCTIWNLLPYPLWLTARIICTGSVMPEKTCQGTLYHATLHNPLGWVLNNSQRKKIAGLQEIMIFSLLRTPLMAI